MVMMERVRSKLSCELYQKNTHLSNQCVLALASNALICVHDALGAKVVHLWTVCSSVTLFTAPVIQDEAYRHFVHIQ